MVADMPAPCVVGVDMGGTKLLAGAIDADLHVHHRAHRWLAGLEQEAVLATAVDAVEELRAATGGAIDRACFGIPSTIDRRRGVAVQAVNLDLFNVAFADVMSDRLGLAVSADNDANLAALGEQRAGAARGARHVVLLTVGTGIGGGLVLDGSLYHGSQGSAAELGHTVVEIDGPRCQGACPNRGCLEAVASGTALAREARDYAANHPDSPLGALARGGRELTGMLVTELAHDGDSGARELLALVGRRLGVGIANFVNVFNPEVVVVGGGVMGAGELLLAPARAEVAARALAPGRDSVRIVAAGLGSEAGMVGAGAMAWDGRAAAA